MCEETLRPAPQLSSQSVYQRRCCSSYHSDPSPGGLMLPLLTWSSSLKAQFSNHCLGSFGYNSVSSFLFHTTSGNLSICHNTQKLTNMPSVFFIHINVKARQLLRISGFELLFLRQFRRVNLKTYMELIH